MFHRHKWSRWEIVPMVASRFRNGTLESFDTERQKRTCSKCGLIKVRRFD